MPREPKPNRCETCKHWNDSAYLKAIELGTSEWITDESDMGDYLSGECNEIKDKVDFLVLGDGYLECIDTEASFGCVLWTARKEAETDAAE